MPHLTTDPASANTATGGELADAERAIAELNASLDAIAAEVLLEAKVDRLASAKASVEQLRAIWRGEGGSDDAFAALFAGAGV